MDATVSSASGTVTHAESEQLDEYLEMLSSESHASRLRAARGILRLATGEDFDSAALDRCWQIKQTMLRHCLDDDFETRLQIERLIQQIETLEYQHRVERLLTGQSWGGPDSGGPDSDSLADESSLQQRWQNFHHRVGVDSEARAVFLEMSLRFGSTSKWPSLERRGLDSYCSTDLIFISHFGCLAPAVSRRFGTPAKHVFNELKRSEYQQQLPTSADVHGRIVGRLIDHTLRENPYGWTPAERLHLALAYQRTSAARSLCLEVFRCQQPLALDLAAALLAWHQLMKSAPRGSDGDVLDARELFAAALQDRRVVSVAPDQIVRKRLPVAARESASGPAIIRTRVQDVAACVSVAQCGHDVRDWGMPSLQADPIWGLRLASIGFASDAERSLFLALVARQLQASSPAEP